MSKYDTTPQTWISFPRTLQFCPDTLSVSGHPECPLTTPCILSEIPTPCLGSSVLPVQSKCLTGLKGAKHILGCVSDNT